MILILRIGIYFGYDGDDNTRVGNRITDNFKNNIIAERFNSNVIGNSFSLNTIGLDSAITYVSGTATTAINLGQFCASIVQGYTNPDGVNTNQDIFISTWFDQSGNNKNVVSTTTTQQPRIVFGGNLEKKDGKVAVRFIRTSSTILT